MAVVPAGRHAPPIDAGVTRYGHARSLYTSGTPAGDIQAGRRAS